MKYEKLLEYAKDEICLSYTWCNSFNSKRVTHFLKHLDLSRSND